MEKDDEIEQHVAWRRRLIDAVLNRAFDDETLVDMLCTGLSEAHAEGVLDAAYVCQKVADASKGEVKKTAAVLARQIRALEAINRHAHGQRSLRLPATRLLS